MSFIKWSEINAAVLLTQKDSFVKFRKCALVAWPFLVLKRKLLFTPEDHRATAVLQLRHVVIEWWVAYRKWGDPPYYPFLGSCLSVCVFLQYLLQILYESIISGFPLLKDVGINCHFYDFGSGVSAGPCQLQVRHRYGTIFLFHSRDLLGTFFPSDLEETFCFLSQGLSLKSPSIWPHSYSWIQIHLHLSGTCSRKFIFILTSLGTWIYASFFTVLHTVIVNLDSFNKIP